MDCHDVFEIISSRESDSIDESEIRVYMEHIAECDECRNAMRGADALRVLKNRHLVADPDELFANVMATVTRPRVKGQARNKGFWLGTSVGSVVAAGLFALALTFGWFDEFATNIPLTPEFVVALGEPRQMDIAIETDRPLVGASISILLAGDIEIDGYKGQRELSWQADLEAGVNRLSLPVYAIGIDGGQVVVRLTHPLSEKVFVIKLRTDA